MPDLDRQTLLRIEQKVDANTALLRGGSTVEDRGVLGELDRASRRCEASAQSMESSVNRIETSVATMAKLIDQAAKVAREALELAESAGAQVEDVRERVEALERAAAKHLADHGLVDDQPADHLIATERAMAWRYRWRIAGGLAGAVGAWLLYFWQIGWLSPALALKLVAP